VKIFATDVHRGSLERAARGLYDEEAVAGVSEERRARYFVRTGSTYQIVPEFRQMIVFAQHNVIRDAPFTRVDLISCRNMLIYLQPAAQRKVLSLFHFALNRGGILLLGPSETPGLLGRDFETVDRHWQLYRKHSDVRTPVEARPPRPHAELRTGPVMLPPGGRHSIAQLLGTYDVLLDEVMPPSLLLTDRGELVQAFAGASRFLRIQDGRQGLEILELVDDELKLILVGGLKRALNDGAPISFKGVRLPDEGGDRIYAVTIRRLRGRHAGAPHLLVSFEAQGGVVPRAAVSSATEIGLDQVSSQQIAALEAELSYTRETLQAAIEEREASNEELQASYEELQASNEELQSTNEELQSVNEELYTVNAEYQRKIAELTEVTNDMDNLLSSTEVGTIFLDRQLRIRRFTPQVAESFNLVAHDIGRPIDAFANTLDHPDLVDELGRVLRTGEPVERQLRDVRGKAFFLRILPYRVKGTVDGVVLTLIDVSGLRAAEDALFHERYLLGSLLLSVRDAIYFKDARGRFIRCNRAMAARLGLADAAEAVGKTPLDLPDPEAALALHREDEAVLRSGEAQHDRIERRIGRGLEGEGWDLVTRLPLRDREQRIVGIIVIFRDVTAQKAAEERSQEAVRRRDQFLAMLSHELRNPLGAMVTATAMLKTGGTERLDRGRLLAILDRQSQQMSRLLDDLLEASRVTQNKIELRKCVVDLVGVVSEAADAVRGQMDSHGVHFAVDIAPGPILVDGDPARLQQIQVNLLSNAIKYTPRGGRVALEVGHDAAGAVIRVRDDGVGIPPYMLESIFELFVQSTRTLDHAGGGLGLGLTLVRSLVTMHGGTVTAASEGEGHGSVFEVRLPVVSAGALAPAPAGRDGSQLPAGPARILVVEDNADSREMLCELLLQAGFECRAVESGSAALALMDAMKPDIVILDVGLPEMDGFEIARHIRANPRHAGVCLIALTGYGQAADRTASREAGFDVHLVKPVHAEQLLTLLREGIRRPGETTPPEPDGAGSAGVRAA
jgi:two-component system, chemotaxis family, CheB/CheR fusion protein